MAAATIACARPPSKDRPRLSTWAVSQKRPDVLPICAAGGKGFGEPMKQQKNKGKAQKGPASSLPPSRGFGDKQSLRKESEAEAVPLAAADEPLEEQAICSCGGGDEKLSYSECCMPFHMGTVPAPDALTLLRARYSAFARGIVGYIVNTTHPESPDNGENLPANARATCDQLRFHKLEILKFEQISDQESNISYRVMYGKRGTSTGEWRSLEEKSLFVREGDAWLFQDGEVLSRSSGAQLVSASTTSGEVKP